MHRAPPPPQMWRWVASPWWQPAESSLQLGLPRAQMCLYPLVSLIGGGPNDSWPHFLTFWPFLIWGLRATGGQGAPDGTNKSSARKKRKSCSCLGECVCSATPIRGSLGWGDGLGNFLFPRHFQIRLSNAAGSSWCLLSMYYVLGNVLRAFCILTHLIPTMAL